MSTENTENTKGTEKIDIGGKEGLNFLRGFLHSGLIIAYSHLFFKTENMSAWGLKAYPISLMIYEGFILGVIGMALFICLPIFYQSRKFGSLYDFLESCDIEVLQEAKPMRFWTTDVFGMVIVSLYFWLIMQDVNLTMANVAIIVLWRITNFMVCDVIDEHVQRRLIKQRAQ